MAEWGDRRRRTFSPINPNDNNKNLVLLYVYYTPHPTAAAVSPPPSPCSAAAPPHHISTLIPLCGRLSIGVTRLGTDSLSLCWKKYAL